MRSCLAKLKHSVVICWKLCTCVKLRKLIGVVPTALSYCFPVRHPVHLCDETKYSRCIMSWSLLTSLLPSKWNTFLLPFSFSRHVLYGSFICLLSTQSGSKEMPVVLSLLCLWMFTCTVIPFWQKKKRRNACLLMHVIRVQVGLNM